MARQLEGRHPGQTLRLETKKKIEVNQKRKKKLEKL